MSLSENLTRLDSIFAISEPNLVESLKRVMSGKKQSKKVSSLYIGALSGILNSDEQAISRDDLVNLLLNIYGYNTETVKKLGTEIARVKALVTIAKAEGFKVSKKKSSAMVEMDVNDWCLCLRLKYSPKSGNNSISVELSCKVAPDRVNMADILQSSLVKQLTSDDYKFVARWTDFSPKRKKDAIKKKWTTTDLQEQTGDLYNGLLGVISLDEDMKKFRPESIFDTLRVTIQTKVKGESAARLAIGSTLKKKKVKRTVSLTLSIKNVSMYAWDAAKQELVAVSELVQGSEASVPVQ
jgi:hypothetical protein